MEAGLRFEERRREGKGWRGFFAYCVDFNMAIHVLGFDGHKKRAKPFEGAEVPTDPEKIHFPEPRLLLGKVHSVPNTFQDRGERGNANPGANKKCYLVFENIF